MRVDRTNSACSQTPQRSSSHDCEKMPHRLRYFLKQLRNRDGICTLAHVGRWQGRRARYRGLRKNLFDLRRCAVVYNLRVLARSQGFLGERQNAA